MNFLASILEKVLGGWLTKLGSAIYAWAVNLGKVLLRRNKKATDADKYAEAINELTKLAKEERSKLGTATPETRKQLQELMRRRNLGVPFDGHE